MRDERKHLRYYGANAITGTIVSRKRMRPVVVDLTSIARKKPSRGNMKGKKKEN